MMNKFKVGDILASHGNAYLLMILATKSEDGLSEYKIIWLKHFLCPESVGKIAYLQHKTIHSVCKLADDFQ